MLLHLFYFLYDFILDLEHKKKILYAKLSEINTLCEINDADEFLIREQLLKFLDLKNSQQDVIIQHRHDWVGDCVYVCM